MAVIGSFDIEWREIWPRALAASLLLVICLEDLTCTSPDLDLWGYLAFGRQFWQTGAFPYHDVFAYAPTLPLWVYHEWLTGVLFYPIMAAFGAAGLQLLKYALGLAAMGLIYLTARRGGADFWGALAALAAIQGLLILGYTPVRAQTFSYLFFSLSLFLLETARLTGKWRRLYFLVPVQILWCNLHGGFLAGLGLIFLYAAGEALSRRPFLPYLPPLALSGLGTLINPYGLDYWRYLVRAISMPRPEITEWASLWRAYKYKIISWGDITYYTLVILVLFMLLWRYPKRELTPSLILGVTLYLGLMHIRHMAFFLLAMGAYIAPRFSAVLEVLRNDPWLTPFFRRVGRKMPAFLAVLVIVFYAGKIVRQDPLAFKPPALPEQHHPKARTLYYPLGAVAFITKNSLSGNLLTEFNWGEYLIWTLYPRIRVSLDGRFETVYPEEVCRSYFDFKYGRENWRQFLQKYPPDMILIDSRFRLHTLLNSEPGWRRVYHDSGCVLFLRQDVAPAAGSPGRDGG